MESTCLVNQSVLRVKLINPGGATVMVSISGLGTISLTISLAIVNGLTPVARANFRGKLEA
jgi:hypothetical protein